MAIATIVPIQLSESALSDAIANTAIDATLGAQFTMVNKGWKYFLVLENASVDTAKDITIKGGDNFMAAEDVKIELAAASSYIYVFEEGKHKNVSGKNKNKVLITGTDANIKVSVYMLP